jgi:MoxR-like ATPase
MFNVRVTYPTRQEEARILKEMSFTDKKPHIEPIFDPAHILKVRRIVNQVYIDQKVEDYILDIVEATRDPLKFGLKDLAGLIRFGVSPRATIHLTTAAKAYAFIQGRAYARPQDIKDIAMDVLRHRLIESHAAMTGRLTAEDIIQKILDELEMP